MSEAGTSKGNKNHCKYWGSLNNYRYLSRKAMLVRAYQNAKTRTKHQKTNKIPNKRKRTDDNKESLDAAQRFKTVQLCDGHRVQKVNSVQKPANPRTNFRKIRLPLPPFGEGLLKTASVDNRFANQDTSVDKNLVAAALGEQWDIDSGFSSESSPPASGRCSPCLTMCPTTVVAMDCEMVGTGPGGRTSELARCSLVDYHGNVLYDKYIRPCQPVVDYRTRWSGIQKHHLQNAVPFLEARTEILQILEGKLLVGHALHNDFQALDFTHPGHMIRDTCGTRLLRQLAGFPTKHRQSLKILANSLLNRKIQVGRKGHNSVEDALASLDLYKLVEEEWEQEIREKLKDREMGVVPGYATFNHYMQDKYWPVVMTEEGQ
ncbi:hypothetical protein UPYG_G00260100 [Umbra pygmaea]|uniref:Exonuclease domain-containing protein n=1 Tax=Umbra pygmaea TaxID=75934 RepID=A0ABD0W8X4_UMBPY